MQKPTVTAQPARKRLNRKAQQPLPKGEVIPPPLQQASGGGEMVAVMSSEFSGPLPPPKHFAAYENTLPGSADRILKMAEREQQHIHAEYAESRSQGHVETKLGMTLGACLSLSLIICVTVLCLFDKTVPALFVGAGGIGAIAYALVTHGRRAEAANIEQD